MRDLLRDTSARGPWFRTRPAATVTVAAALFAAVFVLRLAVGQPDDVVSMLFTLPIALVAMAFGLRGGVLAGLVALALVVIWRVVDDVAISPLGWASRGVPLLLLGALVGDAADRMREVERRRRQLALAAERQRDAIEINDTIVQGISAAKWAFEAGNVERGLATLTETLRTSQALVSELLRNAADRQSSPDDVYRSTPRRLRSSGEA